MSKLLADIAAAWRPPPAVRHAEWIPQHVYVPRQGQSPIRFDLDTYPHAADVLACFDDPHVREIYLGWSAQGLGKTTVGIALMVSIAANMPRPMLALRENQENTEAKLFGEQIVPTLEACLATRKLLPPPHRRTKDFVSLEHCRIWRAYSGAPGTLSGFPAAVALCSEVSKWSTNKTGEADPVELVVARLINYPFDSKAIFESTPAHAETCRITKLSRRKGVLRLKRFCPCPHCGEYQLLVFGGREPDAAGVKWDKLPNGRSDPQLAEETAWYQCRGTRKCRIEDEDRHELLRNGVWLADNQSIARAKVRHGRIVKAGRIKGRRPIASKIAFGDPVDAPFGALYSLAVSGWGFTARAFFDSSRQQFCNSILGAVYDPLPVPITANILAARLKSDVPRGHCPAGTRFLTFAADVGIATLDLIFYWLACAWNNEGVGHVVDWGYAQGDAELWPAAARKYPVVGAPLELAAAIFGLDSGGGKDDHGDKVTERVYALCAGRTNVWPLKGTSNITATTDWYIPGFQRSGVTPRELKRKRKAGLGDLLLVNTPVSQSWRESLVEGRIKPGQKGHVTLPAEVHEQPELYEDFLEELTNDIQIEGRWEKRGGAPNEYGDALRYSRTLAELYTRGGALWGQLGDPAGNPLQTTLKRTSWFAQQQKR